MTNNASNQNPFTTARPRIPVEQFLDANHIHGRQRGVFYGFLSLKLANLLDPTEVKTFVITNSLVSITVPVNDQAFFLFSRSDNKVYVVTTYDPLYGWLDADFEDRDQVDDSLVDSLLGLEEFSDLSDKQKLMMKQDVILQCPRSISIREMFSKLVGKDIELMVFKANDDGEWLEPYGSIVADSVIVDDKIKTDFIVFKRTDCLVLDTGDFPWEF